MAFWGLWDFKGPPLQFKICNMDPKERFLHKIRRAGPVCGAHSGSV